MKHIVILTKHKLDSALERVGISSSPDYKVLLPTSNICIYLCQLNCYGSSQRKRWKRKCHKHEYTSDLNKVVRNRNRNTRSPMSNKKLTVELDHGGGLSRKKSHSSHLAVSKGEWMPCLCNSKRPHALPLGGGDLLQGEGGKSWEWRQQGACAISDLHQHTTPKDQDCGSFVNQLLGCLLQGK